MKFGTYKTMYKEMQSKYPGLLHVPETEFYATQHSGEFYRDFLSDRGDHNRNMCGLRIMSEAFWTDDKRPFYNVYPHIAKCAESFDVSQIRRCHLFDSMSMPTMLLLFSEGAIFDSMLTSLICMPRNSINIAVLFFLAVQGDRKTVGQIPLAVVSSDGTEFHETDAMLFDKECDSFDSGVPEYSKAISIAVFMALAQSNKDLFEPIICDSYKHLPHDESVRKSIARRHGQQCWSVGKSIEATPHYRRPHMATFWTGKGATVPCIKLRKGCVVSREKMTKMPTGYLLGKTNEANCNNTP